MNQGLSSHAELGMAAKVALQSHPDCSYSISMSDQLTWNKHTAFSSSRCQGTQNHAPKPLPPPPPVLFLSPFLPLLRLPASRASAAEGPSSTAAARRVGCAAAAAAAVPVLPRGRLPARAAWMGSAAAPDRPRATHCCVTHLVFPSAASSAVCSELWSGAGAGRR